MIKKTKLIIAGSTVLAGSVITGIAVPLSQKANQPTPEQKQEQQQEKTLPLTEENKGQVDPQKDSTEDKQQNGVEAGSDEKTEEDKKAAESTKPQVDPQKDNDTQKQQDEVESESGEKTEENSGQVDSQNNSTEDKQQNGAKAGSDEKNEENSGQAESTKPQVDSQKDSDTQKQQDEVESGSGEDNKAAQPMESQVDSQNNGNENQQNNMEGNKKVEDSSAVESSKQKGTELQSQLTPVNLYFRDKYFFLRLRTSKETFEKIKQDRLKFILEKGLREYVEQASGITQSNHTAYYLNYSDEHNGNVSFEITSEQSYGSEQEKGQYKVTKVWLSNDTSEKNLLNKESNLVDVK